MKLSNSALQPRTSSAFRVRLNVSSAVFTRSVEALFLRSLIAAPDQHLKGLHRSPKTIVSARR